MNLLSKAILYLVEMVHQNDTGNDNEERREQQTSKF